MARRIDGEQLSQRMKAFRDEKGLSQVAAAKRLGFDLRQWTRWENGEHLPQASNLERLIDAVGMDESELFGDWTEPAVRVARLEERLAAVERRVAGLERITADDDEGAVDDENTVTTWTVEAELELPG